MNNTYDPVLNLSQIIREGEASAIEMLVSKFIAENPTLRAEEIELVYQQNYTHLVSSEFTVSIRKKIS